MSNSKKQKRHQLSLKKGLLICLVSYNLLSFGTLMLSRPVFSEEKTPPVSQSSTEKATNLAPWPRLLVDNDLVDFGDVPFGKMLEYTFNLKNAGAQSLNIMGTPEVKILEGC